MAEDHKLTSEQKRLIVEYINGQTGSDAKCPFCGHRKLGLGDSLAAAPLLTVGGNLHIGKQYPLAVLICENCLHTMMFAALRIPGLYPQAATVEATVKNG